MTTSSMQRLVDFRKCVLAGRGRSSDTEDPISAELESGFQMIFASPQQLAEAGWDRDVETTREDWITAPPSVQLVSLAPRPSLRNPRHLGSMVLNQYFYDLLTTRMSRVALNDFAQRTNCFLFTKEIYSLYMNKRKCEIGLYDLDDEVIENAKKEVNGMLKGLLTSRDNGHEGESLVILNMSAEIEKASFGLPPAILFPATKSLQFWGHEAPYRIRGYAVSWLLDHFDIQQGIGVEEVSKAL